MNESNKAKNKTIAFDPSLKKSSLLNFSQLIREFVPAV